MTSIADFEGGHGTSRLRHVIKQLGYNKDVDIEFATVTAPLPNIRVRIDNLPFDLEEEDVLVCEHLREHKRRAEIDGNAAEITFEDSLKAGDRVIVVSYYAGQNYVILDRI